MAAAELRYGKAQLTLSRILAGVHEAEASLCAWEAETTSQWAAAVEAGHAEYLDSLIELQAVRSGSVAARGGLAHLPAEFLHPEC